MKRVGLRFTVNHSGSDGNVSSAELKVLKPDLCLTRSTITIR